MAFEVTATRMRPKKFDELCGQEFVVSTLKSSIDSKRIAHAYLFSGPRGVGKTSAARILAKSLNCLEGPTVNPCGVCNNCKEISRGNSLDVIEIDGASNTSVNDIREIKDEVLFGPNGSKYKIYIIDEVHMLSNSAFNALLKTIEEPPPYIIFIFATTEIHKVPATIRSRCQQFNFRLIGSDDIKNSLQAVCEGSGIEFEEEALFWIAKEATGSLRDSYTLFDQVVSFSDGKITIDKIKEKLGLLGVDELNNLAEFFIKGDNRGTVLYFNDILTRGVSIEQFIVDMTEYFRNLLMIKNGITKASLLGFHKERYSVQVIEILSSFQMEKAMELLFEIYRNLKFSLNPRFEIELLLTKLCSISDLISQKELISQLNEIRNSLPQGKASSVVQVKKKTEFAPRDNFLSSLKKNHTGTNEENVSVPKEKEEPALSSNNPFKRKLEEKTAPPESAPVSTEPEVRTEKIIKEKTLSVSVVKKSVDIPVVINNEPGTRNPVDARKEIVKAVSKKSMTISSMLDKALSWGVQSNKLILRFRNKFESSQVFQDRRLIENIIKDICSKEYFLDIKIENEAIDNEIFYDDKVELVKKVFRGEIYRSENG